jgi:hypothetical protein
MNIELLNLLRKQIEGLQTSSHFEIFKLIQKYEIPYNENSNGIFINMSTMTNDCIIELQKHLNWLSEQQHFLEKDETVKEQYRENFFNSI